MHTEHYSFVNLFFSNSKLGVGNHLVMNNFITFSQLRSSFNVSRNKYRFGVQTETVLEKNRVITIGLTTQDWFINSF